MHTHDGTGLLEDRKQKCSIDTEDQHSDRIISRKLTRRSAQPKPTVDGQYGGRPTSHDQSGHAEADIAGDGIR